MLRIRLATAITALWALNGCELITDFSHSSSASNGGNSGNGGENVGGVAGENATGGKKSTIETTSSKGGSKPINAGTEENGGSATRGGESGTGGTTSSTGTTPNGGVTSTSGTSALVNGGASGSGGTSSAGGTVNGGTSSKTSGGASGIGGTTLIGGTTSTGGTTTVACSGTLTSCSSTCVNTQTDKLNCGKCGTTCEGYQFCDGGKCLPTYVSTKTLSADASHGIWDARVAKNSSQGDLFLLFEGKNTVLSDPTSTFQTIVNGPGLARFSAQGDLIWGRNVVSLLSANNVSRTFALTSNLDIGVKYRRSYQPSGPVGPITYHSFARIGGNDPTVVWKVDSDSTTTAQIEYAQTIAYRQSKNDFIVVGSDEWGVAWQVEGNSTEQSIKDLGAIYARGTTVGVDGSTLWTWGAHDGTMKLNPWSTQTWEGNSNPAMGGGYDAFIVGSKDNGTTVGPWFTEGDFGPTMLFAIEETGDLIVVVEAYGYTMFNGGQLIASSASSVLIRVRQTDGKILWRTVLPVPAAQIATIPGDRVAILEKRADFGAGAGPYGIYLYSTVDGRSLSTLSTGLANPVPTSVEGNGGPVMMAAGTSDLFVIGAVVGAADFNPGSATDMKGSTPGVFISRYTF